MNELARLARAFDTKGYPDDKNPNHWRKIKGAPTHIDNSGNINGGAGGKFNGNKWTGVKAPYKPDDEAAEKKDALKSLAEATTQRTASGATEAECAKGRATVPAMQKYDEHRRKIEDAEYAKLGFSKQERAEFEENLKRIFNNCDYGMNIKQNVLAMVLNSKFKNQYETGTSGGELGPTALQSRATIFGGILGSNNHATNAFSKESREKYGSFVSKDVNDEGADDYGPCVVRFKKERLAGKTTYTCGDSLTEYEYTPPEMLKNHSAGDADHPSIASFSVIGPKYNKETLLEGVKKSNNVNDLMKNLMIWSYVETQYHGDLTADDIGSVTFHEKPNAQLVKKLKEKGIEVYDASEKPAKRI